jgi:predicted regulator of Ras-like GTPase activity (Roadblock/LC7/MglB family)
MKAALGPLAALQGVHLAMLVSQDGVPIVVRGETRQSGGKERIEDAEVLAALAAGWIADLARATAPISWAAPRHIVLRASRGTLIALQVPRALLVVVLGGGMQPAELRLPMEAAVARLQRSLKVGVQRSSAGAEVVEVESENNHPPGILPVRNTAPVSAADEIGTAQNRASEPFGPSGE